MRDNITAAGSIATADSKPIIESWLRSVGIWWDESLVQIRSGCSGCSGPNLGVFAVADITENQLLCVIPRSAILSPRTTRLASVLEQERLGGGLALTIAVMYEASLGPGSKWAGYFASLPRREYLPVFWNDAELELLQGTSLDGRGAADRQDTQEDYEAHVLPLLQKYPQVVPHPELCGLDNFRVAASWVASRCFCVDDWHGDAMVPLADIFNHKASVVLLDDAWGVAELAEHQRHDADHQAHSHDESSDQQDDSSDQQHDESTDSSDDIMEATANRHSHRHGPGACGSDCLDNEHHHEVEGELESEYGSEHGSEVGSEDAGSGSDSEEGSEDAQHGFAVGGMPIISAAVPDGKASGPARWVRDGINLRLEIGICSMGPPDIRKLPPTPCTAAAAADAQTIEAAPVVASPAAATKTAAAAAAAAAGSNSDAQQQPAKRHKADPAAHIQHVQEAGGQPEAPSDGTAAAVATRTATTEDAAAAGGNNDAQQQPAKRHKADPAAHIQHVQEAGGQPEAPSDAKASAAATRTETAAAAAAGNNDAQPAKRHKAASAAAKMQHVQEAGGEPAGQQRFPEQRLDIVAASAVAAGAEVHNTYGELGNAQLVAKYGFCLPRNPFDEVTLCDDWAGFITGSSSDVASIKPPAKLKQHIKWLQKHSNLLDEVAEDEEVPDPPQITPGGRLNLMTAAVVRLLGASAAQLKGWQGLEDVLQNPESDTEEAPAAVPLTSAAAAAADECGEAKEVSQHFDDIMLSQRPVSWWGRAGLELLVAAVQRRLQQYPCSLEDARLALQQQQQQQRAGGGAVEAAEHSAARAAALQLRVCEQEALHEVLAAVQVLLQ